MATNDFSAMPYGTTVQGVDAANLNQAYNDSKPKPPVKVRPNKKKKLQVSYGVTRDGITSVG